MQASISLSYTQVTSRFAELSSPQTADNNQEDIQGGTYERDSPHWQQVDQQKFLDVQP